MGLDFGELLVGVFQLFGEALEGFALGRDLGGLDFAVADGVVGGLAADALGLGGGVVGIELEEAGGEDIGLLLGVDDVEFALEAGEGGAGTLHLGP